MARAERVWPPADFVRHFARSFLEFLDALAQTAGKFRDFFGAEQNQNGHQDDNQFRAANRPCEQGIHKFCRALQSLRLPWPIVKRQK
jgi:hypothetical protein